jgi:hypothetical protein
MSSTEHGTISAGQEIWLIGLDLSVPLKSYLHYSCQDPYAVRLSLDAGRDEPVEWFLSRDLLTAALHSRQGIGDVRAWPSSASAAAWAEEAGLTGGKVLNIELGRPDEYARFESDAAGIGAFLARTYELVPAGEESGFLDIDAGLAQLLSQA